MRIESTFLSVAVLACTLIAAAQETAPALAERARHAMDQERYAEAVALYKRMLKILPDEPGVKLNLALALDAASRPREALKYLEQIRSAEAENPRFWFLLGIEYQKLRQPGKAVGPLETAVKLSPHEWNFRLELADALLGSGAWHQAAGAFRALSAERPSDTRVMAGLARSDLALANEAYRALTQSAPGSSFRLSLDALTAAENGDRAKAAGLYREAQAAQPAAPWLEAEQRGASDDSTDAGHPLARLFHHGDLEAVVERTASARTPEELYWRARAGTGLARIALARLASLPPSPEAHELAGIALRQAGRWEDSRLEFQEAVKLAPGDRRLEGEFAEACWLSRRYDDAVALLSQLTAKEPSRGEWQYELGDSLFNLGRPEEALPYLRRANALSPDDFAIQATFGKVLLLTGRFQEAASILERAASRDSDGSIHFQLAAAYRNLGRADLAKQALAAQKEIEDAARRRASH